MVALLTCCASDGSNRPDAMMSADPARDADADAGEPDGQGGADAEARPDAAVTGDPRWVDVTATHLPSTLSGFSMDARPADIDGDGDLDLVIASEFRTNILLINDGQGRFTDESDRLPRTTRDSEDVVIHDFDGDDDLDILIVSEDDQTNEFYLNEGGQFTDASDRIPVRGTSNAAILDTTTDPATVLIGNAGPNTAIRWSTVNSAFIDVTAEVLPSRNDQTQDLELGDVDGDGDLDLAVGNEDASVVLLREADRFVTVVQVPVDSETREIDLLDADGDGDLDIALGNIRFLRQHPRRNRILLQTSPLVFEDRSDEVVVNQQPRLPADEDNTFDIDAVDIDADGDPDLITANLDALSGNPANAPYRVYLNDGQGSFTLTDDLLPATAVGNGFDIEAADFNGDGRVDLFLASRGGDDRLLLSQP